MQLARYQSLRETLPPSALAAGYAAMYAATGVGYAASAILAGVGLTPLLTAASALGELAPRGLPLAGVIVARGPMRRNPAFGTVGSWAPWCRSPYVTGVLAVKPRRSTHRTHRPRARRHEARKQSAAAKVSPEGQGQR